ncbi:MAG: prephenate dehydrogenase [Vicinamibacterales bacterium]
MTEPPFGSVAIVGLGLIGGSIALAIRENWPSMRVVGVDSQSVAAHALGSGAIDRAVDSVAGLPATDLVILAAPVQQNVALLADVNARHASIVTDVGGTKRSIVEAARALPDVTFVGGHPLGGGERGGFAFARADLFRGRPWIFTPDVVGSGLSRPNAIDRLTSFATGLGAQPATMTPDDHDRLMAYVSHLPQLAASALMEVVGSASTADGLRMAGKGLFDTTRLASSPADVWRDICATNADAIGPALDRLIERLTELRADLDRGGAVQAVFEEAARWRAALVKTRE